MWEQILSDLLTKYFPILFSGLALWLSWKSFKDRNEFYKVSLKPLFNIHIYTLSENGVLKIVLMNKGVGPGIVQSINIENNGNNLGPLHFPGIKEFIKKSMDDAAHEYRGFQYEYFINGLRKDSILAKDEEKVLLKIKLDKEDIDLYKPVVKKFNKLKIKCSYKSIYDEYKSIDKMLPSLDDFNSRFDN